MLKKRVSERLQRSSFIDRIRLKVVDGSIALCTDNVRNSVQRLGYHIRVFESCDPIVKLGPSIPCMLVRRYLVDDSFRGFTTTLRLVR